jgi:TolB protein
MKCNLRTTTLVFLALYSCALGGAQQKVSQASIGIFEARGDVGETPKKGSVEYDAATGEYRVTGGGANIWATIDAFQFAWKRLAGDVTVTADVHFIGVGKAGHRKAVLMIRQGLEPGAAYADVALHGDGLTSLQFRPVAGVETQEVKAEASAPPRIRIERHGNQFTMYVGNPGEEMKLSGTATVALQDPVYVGIGVCSHDADTLEAAVFSNVQVSGGTLQEAATVSNDPVPATARPHHDARARRRSQISVYDLGSKSISVIYASDNVFEAPNWSPDGKYLLANSGGNLFRIPLDRTNAVEPRKMNLGSVSHCNNDHGISRDGAWLALSAESQADDAEGSQLLSWLVAGWTLAGFRRRAERDFQYLPGSGVRRRGTAADFARHLRRWSGLFARRQVDLLQLQSVGELGHLADAGGRGGRERPQSRAGDAR